MFRIWFLLAIWSGVAGADNASLSRHLAVINSVGNAGEGHRQAMESWQAIAQQSDDALPLILAAIDDDKPLAANWLRAAVDQIAERVLHSGRKLPSESLERFVFDRSNSPRARRLAYEWLLTADADAKARIIPQMLDDPSVEMRRDAVAIVLQRAEAADSKQKQLDNYRLALSSARDLDQIDQAYEKMVELGAPVDLPRHFGFLCRWKVIGPFDNSNKNGFPVAYPPEKEQVFQKGYVGKAGQVTWLDYTTDDKYGMVNLNDAIGKHMGAVAYAHTSIESDEEREIDLRLGSVNATKVWLNGKQLMAHEVYHSGTKIDQYIARGKLIPGPNSILIKVCQNEQTETWAQDWQFQFRVCDRVGTAVLAKQQTAAAGNE